MGMAYKESAYNTTFGQMYNYHCASMHCHKVGHKHIQLHHMMFNHCDGHSGWKRLFSSSLMVCTDYSLGIVYIIVIYYSCVWVLGMQYPL